MTSTADDRDDLANADLSQGGLDEREQGQRPAGDPPPVGVRDERLVDPRTKEATDKLGEHEG